MGVLIMRMAQKGASLIFVHLFSGRTDAVGFVQPWAFRSGCFSSRRSPLFSL
jgi:hypothetical protein